MTDTPDPSSDRRRPTVRTLHQPVQPAVMIAMLGGREVRQNGEVVTMTDRTVIIEVDDPSTALAFTLASEVTLVIDLGGGPQTVLTEPGRRHDDIPSSRRVELVMRDID